MLPTEAPVRHKRAVTESTKKQVASSQQWKCGRCFQLLDHTYEVDHRLALYCGGDNGLDNLVALCPHCHRLKTVDEAREARARKEEEMRLATRRAQVNLYFEESRGDSVPVALAHHILRNYCGWPAERVVPWLEEMGYFSTSEIVLYPRLTWQYVWASAGAGAMLERDHPVHNLKLKPNAPFTLRETAQLRAEREMQANKWRAANAEEARRAAQKARGKPPRMPPSPGRGDGVKPTDMSVLFEEFRFNRE